MPSKNHTAITPQRQVAGCHAWMVSLHTQGPNPSNAPAFTYLLLVFHCCDGALLPPINLLHSSGVLIHKASLLGAQLSQVRPDEQRQTLSIADQKEFVYWTNLYNAITNTALG